MSNVNGLRLESTAVLFDAVGTLIDARPAVADVYASIGRRFGSRLTADDVAGRFHAAFAAEERLDAAAAHRTDEARELRRWRSIVGNVLTDLAPADREPAFSALWSHFARPESWRLYDDVEPTLAALAARGATIGVASNFDRRLIAILQSLLPQIPADRVFVSSLVGHRKPSPEFFSRCAQRLRRSAVVLVGDDLDNDFSAAAAAGLAAVLIDRDDRHADLAPRIRRLTELCDSDVLSPGQ